MSKILYTKDHEWVLIEESDPTIAVVGITDYAQDSLGDIVYVDFPSVDEELGKGSDAGVVESAKSASDIYAPIGGRVVEINEALKDSPNLINQSPMDKAWLFKLRISNKEELSSLISEEKYQEFLKTLI